MAVPVRRQSAETSRWDPFDRLARFDRQLAHVLDEWPWSMGDTAAFTPMADVEEQDDCFVVELELPGIKREDVNVELRNRRLTITGERKHKERTGVLRSQTRTMGTFNYEFVLPADVTTEGVQAKLEEGVLWLRIPKAEGAQAHRIQIS